jgi:hypothetical protein
VFAVQAYFSTGQWIETQGETKVYNGLEVDGVGPLAGVTRLIITSARRVVPPCTGQSKGGPVLIRIEIAVGNFVDPDFPPPSKEVFTSLRLRWVAPVLSAEQFTTLPEEGN